MHSYIKIILFLGFTANLGSCTKFLDEQPSKTSGVEITNLSQIEALLNNYERFATTESRGGVMGSDDFYISKELYDARPALFSSAQVIQFMMWETDELPNNQYENLWSFEYGKIFSANMALHYLEKNLPGTEEQKAIIKADAHLIRAYSYFELAQVYCLPYSDATKNEPGLPLKTTISFEESFVRRPLHEVYELIESDIKDALSTPTPLKDANGKTLAWKANKAAVNGFAARFYLTTGKYAEALDYANKALAESSALVDYNTEMNYGNDVTVTLDAGTAQQKQFTVKHPSTSTMVRSGDILQWKENMYFRIALNPITWFIPSPELLNLYDQDHDLRYAYHIVEGYSYERGMTKPSFNYAAYEFFGPQLLSGVTTAEVMLIKAECLARDNKVGEALAVINALRSKRMTPGSWVDLTAGNKDEAIAIVLEERRRERPFVQRWSDIKRLNSNNDPSDDVNALTRVFYPYNSTTVLSNQPVKTYTLLKGSRRWAQPIANTEIVASREVIQQNQY